jgi:hypothetical protein
LDLTSCCSAARSGTREPQSLPKNRRTARVLSRNSVDLTLLGFNPKIASPQNVAARTVTDAEICRGSPVGAVEIGFQQ